MYGMLCTFLVRYVTSKLYKLLCVVCIVSIPFVYQVRLPNGGTMRQSFQSESTLGDVLAYVTSQCPGQISLVQVLSSYIHVLDVFVCVV